MSRVRYFAYGSNMSRRRLCARTPSARVVDVAQLHGHRLAFHKRSLRDGSGKCDIVEDPGATVYGVLYTIEAAEKATLDRLEGLGEGYAEKRVELELRSGARMQASTYVATRIDATLKPFGWYKRHVLEGAREAGLPPAYVAAIEATVAEEDPDRAREAEELAIYGPAPPVRELGALLASLEPVRRPGSFAFVSLPPGVALDPALVVASIVEPEGLSVIVPEHMARERGLPITFSAAWITLRVHSDLGAVGLTAAFATALGQAGISCNVVAGVHHDHLFVPVDRAQQAVETLRELQRSASARPGAARDRPVATSAGAGESIAPENRG